MIYQKLVCGECGHVHAFPRGFPTKAPKIICACDGCGARIDVERRPFFGFHWPKVKSRPKGS